MGKENEVQDTILKSINQMIDTCEAQLLEKLTWNFSEKALRRIPREDNIFGQMDLTWVPKWPPAWYYGRPVILQDVYIKGEKQEWVFQLRTIHATQKFAEFNGISWYVVLWSGCEMDEYQNIEFFQDKETVEAIKNERVGEL